MSDPIPAGGLEPELITGFFHGGIAVSDMERSLAFYRDALGLEVHFDVDARRGRLRPRGAGHRRCATRASSTCASPGARASSWSCSSTTARTRRPRRAARVGPRHRPPLLPRLGRGGPARAGRRGGLSAARSSGVAHDPDRAQQGRPGGLPHRPRRLPHRAVPAATALVHRRPDQPHATEDHDVHDSTTCRCCPSSPSAARVALLGVARPRRRRGGQAGPVRHRRVAQGRRRARAARAGRGRATTSCPTARCCAPTSRATSTGASTGLEPIDYERRLGYPGPDQLDAFRAVGALTVPDGYGLVAEVEHLLARTDAAVRDRAPGPGHPGVPHRPRGPRTPTRASSRGRSCPFINAELKAAVAAGAHAHPAR